MAIREIQPNIYEFTILKGGVQIGSIGMGPGGPSLNMSASYMGKNVVFLGSTTSFVGAITRDRRSMTVNVASLHYESAKSDNLPLATLGVIGLDNNGIVASDKAKTGWINWAALAEFTDNGQHHSVKLTDVTFWVNRGGQNWLSFSVGDAHEQTDGGGPGRAVPVTVSLRCNGPNQTATIQIGSHHFHPVIKDSTTLVLVSDDRASH